MRFGRVVGVNFGGHVGGRRRWGGCGGAGRHVARVAVGDTVRGGCGGELGAGVGATLQGYH